MIKNEVKEIILNEKKFIVSINRKNNKNTYIRLKNENVIEVNTNSYTSLSTILDLITKNQDKILKIADNKLKNTLPENKIYYLGNTYLVNVINNSQFSYNIESDEITIYTPYTFEQTLDLFYRYEAEKVLPEALSRCYQRFHSFYDIKYPILTLRKMKSRYGTCYYLKNKIVLNTYLVKYDFESIDYVIYHELSHFLVHNHQSEFYQVLERVCKNHQELKKKINKF